MLESGLKPDAGKPVLLDQFAVLRNCPRAAPERENAPALAIQNIFEDVCFDRRTRQVQNIMTRLRIM